MAMVGIYLLTCRHKTTEGLYEIPLEYMLADLPKGWKPARIKKALGQLEADGFALYDYKKSVVLLPDAMEHQRPDAPGQVKGAITKIAALPETYLWSQFMEAAARHAPSFHACLLDHFPHGMGDVMWDDMAHPQALSQAPAQDSCSGSTPQHSVAPPPSSILQDSEPHPHYSRSSNSPDDSDDAGPL